MLEKHTRLMGGFECWAIVEGSDHSSVETWLDVESEGGGLLRDRVSKELGVTPIVGKVIGLKVKTE